MVGTGVWFKVKNLKLNLSSEGALGSKIRPGSGGTTDISNKRWFQGHETSEFNDSLHGHSNDTCHLLARVMFMRMCNLLILN